MSNYINGQGQFFYNLYTEAYSIETMRKTPSTIEELKVAGLADEDITKYFSLIKQLYGEMYLYTNNLLPQKGVVCESVNIWAQLCDFCFKHNLISDLYGCDFPNELEFFEFIFYLENCIDSMYFGSLDKFRYEVEMQLARLSVDWYLNLRYDVCILYNDENDEAFFSLVRYDDYFDKMVMLSEEESNFLLNKIRADLAKCERSINQHTRQIIKLSDNKSISCYEKNETSQKCLKNLIEFKREYDILEENLELVYDIIESGVHKGVVAKYPDDTLYVCKGRIKCEIDNHTIEQATAILKDKYGNDIELNVSHCRNCHKFFVHYNVYQHYREEYGAILGNLHMSKDGEFYKIGYDLADESPLRLCGYSVREKDSLSKWERQCIIESCIESGAMTKESVIRLLRWFIEVNGSKIGNELAREKWCEDLNFTLAYNTKNQNKYKINKVEKYSRNRFISK